MPESRTGRTLLADAVGHRLATFLAVSLGVAVSVLLLVSLAPSRYDAMSLVGFAPATDSTAGVELVGLGASQFAEAATSRSVLAATEEAAGVPAGTLDAGDLYAEVVPETGMVQLVVSDGDPQVAAELADAVAATIVSSVGGDDLLAAEVIRTAEVPTSPAAPARGLYALAGLLAGVGLGLCVVLGLETWRPRVRSASHLASILGVPTVADLGRGPASSPPVHELRRAQLFLSRAVDDEHQDAGTSHGVAVLAGGAVTQGTLDWVSEGLTGAFANTGQFVQLLDPGTDAPGVQVGAGSNGTVRVLPITHETRNAQGLAEAQSVRRAVVVVGENDPVGEIDRLRHDLEAAGIEIVAGVLVRASSREGRRRSRSLR